MGLITAVGSIIVALKEAGIGPDIITDNGFKSLDTYLDNIPASQPTPLLKEKEKYYFIVTLEKKDFIDQVRKQLLLWGVEDFAILAHDLMFDFDLATHKGLKDAYIKTFNTIYEGMDFTENHFNEARGRFIKSIKWWVEAMEWVLSNYSGRENISLLDVGPGVGLASLTYKKLLGASINWINLEHLLGKLLPSTQECLIESENINVQYGYIETDHFTGSHDIIIFTEIIEHLAYNPVNTLKKLSAMLKPAGHLVITTRDKHRAGKKGLPYYTDWHLLPDQNTDGINASADVLKITGAYHVYEYSRKELTEVIAESGFKIVHLEVNKTGNIICICSKQ